jgi:hypothetical protein
LHRIALIKARVSIRLYILLPDYWQPADHLTTEHNRPAVVRLGPTESIVCNEEFTIARVGTSINRRHDSHSFTAKLHGIVRDRLHAGPFVDVIQQGDRKPVYDDTEDDEEVYGRDQGVKEIPFAFFRLLRLGEEMLGMLDVEDRADTNWSKL